MVRDIDIDMEAAGYLIDFEVRETGRTSGRGLCSLGLCSCFALRRVRFVGDATLYLTLLQTFYRHDLRS